MIPISARTGQPTPPIVARRANRALIYDIAGRTIASIDYDAAGTPINSNTQRFRTIQLPDGDTAYVQTLSIMSRLDTLMSGGVVTRTRIERRHNHAYYRDGRPVFDLGDAENGTSSAADLSVFPNPLTTDRLFVVVPQELSAGNAAVTLHDAAGRLVLERDVDLRPGSLLSLTIPEQTPAGTLVVAIRHTDGLYRQLVVLP